MSDHSDAKLRDVASKMRDVFFEEYGHPNSMSPSQMDECIRSLVAIHCGELVEVAARFKSPERSVREVCIDFLDAMLNANRAEIADLIGDDDQHAYLTGN